MLRRAVPAPLLTVLYLFHHLQDFFRDAVEAQQKCRHAILNIGELLQCAEVGHPVTQAAAMHLCYFFTESIKHHILQRGQRCSAWLHV